MAYWEKDRGCSATYFLLHTASYWHEDRTIEAALQLQDFGHEVGLHVNALGEWAHGKTDDVAETLRAALLRLGEAGVEVTGISSHGDPLCYEMGFSNYWCFRELRPPDPAVSESGLSAEGIPVDDPAFRLSYPEGGVVRRRDGASFDLWSISMAGLGLQYHAVHVAHDSYFTDTGGRWERTEDPLRADLSTGRHQVLVHPQHWRGANRMFFFLSTARSGSKWLTRVVDAGTPLSARHEFTLNHRYATGGCIPEKRTGSGFVDLVADRADVTALMKEARSCIEEIGRDYGEANVYLVHLLDELRKVFPDAELIHLHRDPRAVVRSILNRGWYDTPEDDRHPPVDAPEWDERSAFEKACWYVREVALILLTEGLPRLSLEQISSSPDRLATALRDVNVPFYPRLAGTVFEDVVDPSRRWEVPIYERWSLREKVQFHRICGEVLGRLGYSFAPVERLWKALRPLGRSRERGERMSPAAVDLVTRLPDAQRLGVQGCRVRSSDGSIQISPEGGRHAHVLLGGASWASGPEGTGWPAEVAVYYRGRIEVNLDRGSATLFSLMYAGEGNQIEKRSVARLWPGGGVYTFSFKTKPHAARFDLALYLPVNDQPSEVVLKELTLQQVQTQPR